MFAPKFELSQAGIAGLVGNLYAADREITSELQALGRRYGEALQMQTEANTPVLSGFMSEHVLLRYINNDMGFEVGWSADDFYAQGFEFYPWFVEYGTSRMAAQFPLTRASDQVLPEYMADVGAAVSRAIARLRVATV